MVSKNIRMNKRGTTILALLIGTFIVSGIVIMMLTVLTDNIVKSGKVLPSEYSNLSRDLEQNQKDIENDLNAVKKEIVNLQEPENTADIVLSGVKGFYKSIILLTTVFTTVVKTPEIILGELGFVGKQVYNLITIVILMILVFAFLKLVGGRNKA